MVSMNDEEKHQNEEKKEMEKEDTKRKTHK